MYHVADFETTSYETYLNTGETRVWLWAICNQDGMIEAHGGDIDSFMGFCKKLGGDTIYFHNLKFDGSFIINWLLQKGYPLVKDRLKKSDNKGFHTLIDGKGAWYSITVNLGRRIQVTFMDSLKIVPLKVKEIAKSFNLPIEKERIDYQDYTITPESLEYIYHDVQIPAMALKFFKDQGYEKMTIGGNAYHSFEDSFGSFSRAFPRLSQDFLETWRKAYRGGRSQVNPLHQEEVLHDIRRYDINSMYPYCMSRFPMPYGHPIPINKIGRYRFELYKVDISFKLKEGHLPTLLAKGGLQFGRDTYYTQTDGIERLYMSNIDFELVKKHYDISYCKIMEAYGFFTDPDLFRPWIDEHYKNKQNSKGGLRMVYKLIINNLYGKFGSRCRGAEKYPILGEDGRTLYPLGDMEDLNKYYLPVAIAVTSYAHKMIDDAIMKTGYSNFVYCDTDSVHTLGTLPPDWVDDKEIGKFKLEAVENTSKYLRQKCYITKEAGQWHITCAGLPESLKTYLIEKYGDDLPKVWKKGLSLQPNTDIPREYLKLRPLQVPGGVVLVPTGFEIK